MKLTTQQQDIIDALHCMEWCEIPDLLAAADVASEASLRTVINNLRKAGYDIANRRGWAPRGRVGAYSLRGSMTARQFGLYSARILGPMAQINGPLGLRIIAGASVLRNMLGASEIPLDKRKAMAWALGELEGDQP